MTMIVTILEYEELKGAAWLFEVTTKESPGAGEDI